jgi:hypothetical protein
VKKTPLSIVLCALALVASAQEKPSPAPAGPRIAVEPATFDFGDSVQNKTLHKEFAIRNFGRADLVIESISTTCGCTAALLDSKTVKPGGSTPLRVSLETRTYTGPVERSVLVRSNDAENSRVEIKIKANVQAPPAAK